jgi:hypothetical protein
MQQRTEPNGLHDYGNYRNSLTHKAVSVSLVLNQDVGQEGQYDNADHADEDETSEMEKFAFIEKQRVFPLYFLPASGDKAVTRFHDDHDHPDKGEYSRTTKVMKIEHPALLLKKSGFSSFVVQFPRDALGFADDFSVSDRDAAHDGRRASPCWHFHAA